MTQIKFVDLSAQYLAYKEEINQQVLDVLASIQYIGGPQLEGLEKELQEFCGCQHAIGCSNGTDSLLLALLAAGIKPQDEVITTSFTFVSTVEMICLIGAIPVFIDIDPENCLMDSKLLEGAITPKTKAIIPVSLFGQVSAMDEINAVAQQHSLVVIEDAAQSFGARQSTTKGEKYSCDLSTYACTSFYPAKGLGCYGDGGAVFTDNDDDAKKLRSLLNHGQSDRYEYVNIGINGRLDDIQAAILRVKLRHYKDEIARRCQLADNYTRALENTPTLTPLKLLEGNKSVYSQYSLYAPLSKRDDYRNTLQEQGIPTGVYYPKPLHQHKVFAEFAYRGRDKNSKTQPVPLPHTEAAASRIFSLPVHPFLSDEQQDKIIEVLNRLK
ncbi:MAG: DegT/DnrJ/EryC1/StrS family aminotransferase [Candidatus Portiera sp.]|nr:DegT/DnrJ/EryC1/StrS family aminotransferase [Portiera sp.]